MSRLLCCTNTAAVACAVGPYSYPKARKCGRGRREYLTYCSVQCTVKKESYQVQFIRENIKAKYKGTSNKPTFVFYKHCCCLRCSLVLVPRRGNAEGVEEAKRAPASAVLERRKAVVTARPRDRRDIEARRQAEIAARNKLSPGRMKVQAKESMNSKNLAVSKK